MAADWWLVFTGGETPNRLLVAVNETFLSAVPFAEKTYQLETLTILEDAKAPDSVSSNTIVDCGNGKIGSRSPKFRSRSSGSRRGASANGAGYARRWSRGSLTARRNWCTPTNFEDRGRTRILHYSRSVTFTGPDPSQGCGPGFQPGIAPSSSPSGSPQQVTCVPTPGGPVKPTQDTHECTVSFEFRDGTLIDYVTAGHLNPKFSSYNSCEVVLRE